MRTAIIKINPTKLLSIPQDTVKIRLMGIRDSEIRIPLVKIYKGKLKGEVFFEDRPLLLSYGFFKAHEDVLCNRELLKGIVANCEVITGFFPRIVDDIKREIAQIEEARELAKTLGLNSPRLHRKPLLVKTIMESEVERLLEKARSMDHMVTTDPLNIGSYIILQNYPFEGISAMVLEKRSNGKVRLELLDSGVIIQQDMQELAYTLEPGLI
jgi:hypothetical protein